METKQAVEPERLTKILLVRNISGISQWVGRTETMPGRDVAMDVAPGSIGHALIQRGLFEVVEPDVPMVPQFSMDPGEVSASGPFTLSFKCPCCDFVTPDGDWLLRHQCSEHSEQIARVMAELYPD